MTVIQVCGIPKGQPRVKAYVRGRHAGVYTPDTANEWKMKVREAAILVSDGLKPYTDAVSVEMDFWIPRPKSHFKPNGQLKQAAPIMHTQKPDVDNLAKAVLDVLTDVRLWEDDAQVHKLTVTRNWCGDQQPPGASIWVR